MVKLTPEQQRSFISRAPPMFAPCSGEWGRQGATSVRLAAAEKTLVQTALDAAWKNVNAKVTKKKA
jgi:hypothetical protein